MKYDKQLLQILQHNKIDINDLNFDPWSQLGKTLLIGEGNFTFANSIIMMLELGISNLTATALEAENKLDEETKAAIEEIQQTGGAVILGVDAAKLSDSLSGQRFDTIIFQFPHVGSRDPKYGQNPNFILMRKFLKSAKYHLRPSGRVMISTVDSTHYLGAFRFEDAAEQAGYLPPKTYPFDPKRFKGYFHTNTHDEDSALEDHKKFITWVFRVNHEPSFI